MTRYWIGVASREHVLRGIAEGIAQVCHGKQGPLARMQPDDWIIYYSPTEKLVKKSLSKVYRGWHSRAWKAISV